MLKELDNREWIEKESTNKEHMKQGEAQLLNILDIWLALLEHTLLIVCSKRRASHSCLMEDIK